MIRGIIGWLFGRTADRQPSPEIKAAVAAQQERRALALADATLSPLERLLSWWDQCPVDTPLHREIDALEERHAIRLPDDFRRYLLATMPQGNEWDDEGTRWFPLADIRSLREECAEWDTVSALDSDKLLVFADYLIWCYAWAVDCSDTANRGRVALITGRDHYVADSFDEFLDRYLRDDGMLHR
ncbi:SMI1/KNR4 family protein [Sphingomonas psychrotolerans]|uniref:SMI1/KNR4 family protein n=1 Tax=Sphingomonas psychrotolerans TaxID=1327635 RepID=A0ABU3N568_9SPHN|nr:SMI1/KNR4 family protein [Sphingomonas psychrotolerans]MDT8759664.1 SMI1/KNR4 family protein [Sphingomonas psychrotolerans]